MRAKSGQNIGIFDQIEGHAIGRLFFNFVILWRPDTPVSDGGGTDRNVGWQGGHAGIIHLAGGFDIDQLYPLRRVDRYRPADQGDGCALSGQRGGNRMALLAG